MPMNFTMTIRADDVAFFDLFQDARYRPSVIHSLRNTYYFFRLYPVMEIKASKVGLAAPNTHFPFHVLYKPLKSKFLPRFSGGNNSGAVSEIMLTPIPTQLVGICFDPLRRRHA